MTKRIYTFMYTCPS